MQKGKTHCCRKTAAEKGSSGKMIFSRKKKEPAAAAEKESLPEENEILKMKGITKDYVMGDEVSHVLKGIDLTVTKGEFLAVLGPSGSGKSTLMNIIGCLDTADEGTYILDGISIRPRQVHRFLRDRHHFRNQNYLQDHHSYRPFPRAYRNHCCFHCPCFLFCYNIRYRPPKALP